MHGPHQHFIALRHRLLNPRVPRIVERPLAGDFGDDAERRIDARFKGTLAKQGGGKGVDRGDVGPLEIDERARQPRRFGGRRAPETPFEGVAKAHLQLAGGCFRERDGHDAIERRRAGNDEVDQAIDEHRRLARAGARFEHQRGGEVGANARADGFVGRRLHLISLMR